MRLLFVIAGASRWPEFPSLEANPSLSRSAEHVAELALSPDGLHLRRAELFFVFNDDRSPDAIDQRLGGWLRERLEPGEQEASFGGPVTDLVFYYLGHGHKVGESLFLTVQSTRETNIEQSSWSVAALAQTLRNHAPKLRKHIILDCCHGAAAITAFQKPDDAGVAILYAAEKFSPAMAPPTAELTMFTAAFVNTLNAGIKGAPELLSLLDVCNAIRPALQAENTQPNVVDSIIRDATPASRVGLFPNRVDVKPTSGDLMRREVYARLLEIERRFEERLKRRIDELERDHTAKLNDSASRLTMMTRELQRKFRETSETQGSAIAYVQKQGSDIERRGRTRSFTMLGVGLVAVLALLWSGLFRRVIRGSEEVVVVNPALGWQGGVRVKRDEQICIVADGRVNLGLNQVVNLMNAAKGIIARFAAEGTQTRMAAEADNDSGDFSKLRFRRPWTDPAGAEGDDALLGDARIRPDCNWGRLLGLVVADKDTSRSSHDPFLALKNNNMSFEDVICVGSLHDLTVPRDGELVFIVNDAVQSALFPDVRLRSKEMFDAMRAAAPKLKEESGNRQELHEDSLPLFWYADNGGQYMVRIYRGRTCDEVKSR